MMLPGAPATADPDLHPNCLFGSGAGLQAQGHRSVVTVLNLVGPTQGIEIHGEGEFEQFVPAKQRANTCPWLPRATAASGGRTGGADTGEWHHQRYHDKQILQHNRLTNG